MRAGPVQTVGRERELGELDAALDALGEGELTCVAVEGEPGIGKTTLLAELQARSKAWGHLVLAGSAAEFEQDMPFGVWVDALDAYVASQDLEDPADWSPELLGELAGVLPSLRRELGGEGSALVDERYRAHRAMRLLLSMIGQGTPVAIVLDDLHWADRGSIELISSLLRRGVDAPVLLALGFRTRQTPAALRTALAAAPSTTIALAPLTEKESFELAGEEVGAAERASIFNDSGGNPFYILELARAAGRAARTTAEGQAGGGIVPAVVQAALLGELATLSPAARALLEAGAVAGDPFEPELAYAVGGLATDVGVEALDELLDTGLILPTAVPRQFGFRHPLVRRAVYETARGGWLLAAHGRAAKALAERGASAAARAHHVEQSASQGDAAAIELLLAAGDGSAPRAPAGAARWYAAALRLMPEADVAARIDLLVRLADTLRATGDLHRCRDKLLEGIDLLPPEETETRLVLTSVCAAVEDFMGQHESARARLEEALSTLTDKGSREAIAVSLNLAGGAFFTMELDRMIELATAALDAARGLDEPALIGAAAAMLALAGALAGDVQIAEPHRAEAVARLDALADAELATQLDPVNRLGWAEFYLERYDDSARHLKRGIAVARATGQGQFLPLMEEARALSEMMLGRLDVAAQLQANAIDGVRLADNAWMTCTALVTSSQVAMRRGDVDAALSAAEEAVELTSELDQGVVPALAQASLAAASLEAGQRPERTEAAVQAAGGPGLALLPGTWRVFHQEALSHAELAHGNIENAERYAQHAEAAAGELGLELGRSLAARARAGVMLARGDADGAATLALSSADAAEAAGAPIEAARSHLVAGRALAVSGERDRAVELLRSAEARLAELGSARSRDEARRELRKLGARVEPRGPATGADSGLESLTPREAEIAALVSARKTNREVAAELFLSEKTVESHLRNIFVKLGASSRVEVAREVERGGRGASSASPA